MTIRNTRATAAGVVVLTLAAGFLLGRVWSTRSPEVPEAPVVSTTVAAAEEEEEDRGGENRRRGLIVERVGLSAEQKAQVDSAVAHSREMMRQLRADYRSGYGSLIESTRSSIKAVLTAEQAAEYDSLLDDFDRRRSRDGQGERGSTQSRERNRDPGERDRGSRENQEPGRRDQADRMERDRQEWTYGF